MNTIYLYDQNHIAEAIEAVLAWDLPEEDFAQAVNDQARLMAGCCPDEGWEHYMD